MINTYNVNLESITQYSCTTKRRKTWIFVVGCFFKKMNFDLYYAPIWGDRKLPIQLEKKKQTSVRLNLNNLKFRRQDIRNRRNISFWHSVTSFVSWHYINNKVFVSFLLKCATNVPNGSKIFTKIVFSQKKKGTIFCLSLLNAVKTT